jgi:Mrp family chromosome partitioning ATPase
VEGSAGFGDVDRVSNQSPRFLLRFQFTFAEDERPRTMLVTSSVPGEGKTTVATNLAITMALIWKTKETILDSVFGSRH